MSDPIPATLTATTGELVVKRHPIRGILWGLMMGVGLTVVLVVTTVISLDLTMMIVVTAVSILVGVLWSTVGPPKAPKGPPPTTVTVATAPDPAITDAEPASDASSADPSDGPADDGRSD